MFGLPRERASYHYGSDSYRHIDRMLDTSRRMHIVSPYLDRYYAERIFRNASRSEFYIISSSMDEGARHVLRRRGSLPTLAVYGLFSAALLYAFIALGIYGYALLAPAIPLVIGMAKYRSSSSRSRRIHLKVPDRFVHAKMYVSERQAVMGSANLTYKGMHSNVEAIEVTEEQDKVDKLLDQFWEMWDKY